MKQLAWLRTSIMDEAASAVRAGQEDEERNRRTTKRRNALVLLGCSILQLPIWGMPMTFGIYQDAYAHSDVLHDGASGSIGVVGTTMNGVMYLSMPVLFTLMDRGPWAHLRRRVAVLGVGVCSVALLLCSFATHVWHLIVLQGIVAAAGSALLYSPTTLYLDERFSSAGRATAYGAVLSAKNLTGTCCPLLTSALLDRLGIRWTLRVWAAVTLATGLAGLLIIPHGPRRPPRGARTIPWHFLRHPTFYIYSIANLVFSSGYALPQAYLPVYASDVLRLPSITSAVMVTVFNAPGIVSSVGFGWLSDRFALSATANTCISAMGSCLAALLLWGLDSSRDVAVLILFAACYGFFAGGYSATWGGWIKDLEREAADKNEAINTGMLYGLLNGARGVGYVLGGVVGVELLDAGAVQHSARWGFGTKYGALIVWTGVSAAVGGWGILWSGGRRLKRHWPSLPMELS